MDAARAEGVDEGRVVAVEGTVREPAPWEAGTIEREGAARILVAEEVRATHAVRGGLRGALDGIRRRAEDALQLGTPDPSAALLRGFVLGQDDRISEPVRDDFRRSGLAHVLAVSGQNVMLLVLNLPLIGLWVQLLRVPYAFLFPLVLLFSVIGVYGVSSNIWDVVIMILFGAVGYAMRKLGYEPAPLVLAFVLGKLAEESVRQSLLMSRGSFAILVERPIAGALLAVAVLIMLAPALARPLRSALALTRSASAG